MTLLPGVHIVPTKRFCQRLRKAIGFVFADGVMLMFRRVGGEVKTQSHETLPHNLRPYLTLPTLPYLPYFVVSIPNRIPEEKRERTTEQPNNRGTCRQSQIGDRRSAIVAGDGRRSSPYSRTPAMPALPYSLTLLYLPYSFYLTRAFWWF